MDTIRQTWNQFTRMFVGMSSSQRATLIAVPLMILGGFAALMWSRGSGSETAISWGKVFSTEELIAAEQALIQAGLTDFHREGQRIMVPTSEFDRYNAALLEFDAMPADLGSQMLKQLENMGPFSTDRQRQDLKEAMLLQEVRRTLRAIPDIEDARVVVANPGRRSPWGPRGRVTANVTLKPRANRELTARLVSSIRAAVAGMVPDLKAADVTVFDVMNQVSFTGESTEDPFNSQLMQRISELTRQYEQQIRKGLEYISNVGVTVNVDVENLKSSVVRTQQIDPKKVAALYTSENTMTDSQQQRPSKGEPGQNANRPASLSSTAGSDRTRQFSDTNNQTVNGVSFEVTEKQLIAAMPRAVQVSVTVPRDYYREVVASRTGSGEKDPARLDPVAIETEVLATVQKSVTRLIPVGSPTDSITVSSVDRVVPTNEIPAVPMTAQLMEWLQKYGSTIVLVLFTLWVIRAVQKSIPAAKPITVSAAEAASNVPLTQAQTEITLRDKLRRGSMDEPETTEEIPEVSQRDRLQTLVRDNPETTAAVIGKWLQAAS